MLHKAFLAMLVGMASLIAGCNTIQGAGQDIEAGGQAIEDASVDARR